MNESNQWMLHRAGVLNFWYYDEEYFDFADGKLLLRGSNGSGKSVTMQSLLPVLLDGKTSPDRLDPFGSKARKMEDYLLGEKDIVDRDERTGYLFLEYKRQNTNQYMTTGIGLRAKRNKTMSFWGFVLTDGRRVGADFKLYKEEKEGNGKVQKIPFSKKELEKRVADGGEVVQTKKEYMGLVNKYIFRFDSTDAYEELIKLLIQLRSPKLSKDFKPTVIYEILEGSLPAIADEDLRHISETIENMDQQKQQLEQMERDKRALEKLSNTYTTYNEWLLAEKASHFVKEYEQTKKIETAISELAECKKQLEDKLAHLEAHQERLEREQSVLTDEKEKLYKHDVWDKETEKKEVMQQLDDILKAFHSYEEKLEKKSKKERILIEQLRTGEDSLDQEENNLEEQIERLEEDAADVSFQNHTINSEDFHRHREEDFDFTVWKREAKAHEDNLHHIMQDWHNHEKYKTQYLELYKEIGDLNQELDELRYEEQKWQQTFEEEKATIQERVYAWNEANDLIKMEETGLRQLSQRLNELYEPFTYEDVKAPAVEIFQNKIRTLEKEKIENSHAQKLKREKIDETEKQVNVWKEKRDPEPDRHEETTRVRKWLTEKGILHVPFYAAVEFLDDVSETVRERIEAALEQSGLLDALITEEDVDVDNDRIFVPKPVMMAHTLANYVKPDLDESVSISTERIDEVLRSIIVSEDSAEEHGTIVSEHGQFQIGIVKGHAPKKERADFIGRTARKRLRFEMIASLTEELYQLENELQALLEIEETIESQIEQAQNAYAMFPRDRDAQEAYKERNNSTTKKENKEKEVQRKNEKLAEIYRTWQGVKRELQQKTATFDLEFSPIAYQNALTYMRTYSDGLNELQLIFTRYKSKKHSIMSYREQLEEVKEEVDRLKGELAVQNSKKQEKELKLEKLEERLKEMGAEEIRQEINNVCDRLNEIEKEYPRTIKGVTTTKHLIEKQLEDEKREKQRLAFSTALSHAWQVSFIDEEQLHLVIHKGEDGSASPYERAKRVLKQYGHVIQESDRTKQFERLNKVFFQEQPNLVEYRMTQEKHANEAAEIAVDFELTEEMMLKAADWKQKNSRTKIILEYKGQRVSPYFVLHEIESDYSLQKEYLNEKDRELYEEIILKSVGRILRSKIQRAEQWVKAMDKLMEKRDTSSGLNFSIKWKPRTAETEDEMDTKELVNLLRMNANLLKHEDLQRVTNHFRAKIARARELVEERGQGDTLHQVMKEVLDYRKWFSFVLSYQRTNEPKRELTNQVFFKFSGGEKAMAMYIPLFTAAYSRYQEADNHAPYVISLDEAFAGVDENNIRDMFELVEELGFNYIINSQALWGDYDTVSSLSICELVRPKNAPFVTVLRYHWDGKTRHAQFHSKS
ncbi:TIGR02680 family protein [Bacillus tianshenii]|nr:TIGR02680 family protein [Bacillus tianshenii]